MMDQSWDFDDFMVSIVEKVDETIDNGILVLMRDQTMAVSNIELPGTVMIKSSPPSFLSMSGVAEQGLVPNQSANHVALKQYGKL